MRKPSRQTHYPSFSLVVRTRPLHLKTLHASHLRSEPLSFTSRTETHFDPDWAMRTVDFRDDLEDGREVKERPRRVTSFRTFETIFEEDEVEPPVAVLTPVQDDRQSEISVLDLTEELPRHCERRQLALGKLKPLSAFLCALHFVNAKMTRKSVSRKTP